MSSIPAAWAAQVARAPERPALGFLSPTREVRWHTRAELDARAATAAAWLAAQGARRGEVCLLVLPSDEWSATLLLGALRSGAVPLLVAPPTLPGQSAILLEVLRRTISRTRAALAVCPESLAGHEKSLRGARRGTAVVFADALPAGWSEAAEPAGPPAAEDVAIMQLTSGTTGMPRVCVWRHRHVLAALAGMAAAMRLGGDDRCFNWTPLYHDMGLVNNFLLCLLEGVPLTLLSPHAFVKRPALWLQGLSASGATVTWSPNFGFALAAQRVTDAELAGVRLDGVRAFWNAAERIHLETMQRFHARFASFGVRFEALKTNLGCAENVGGATFSDVDGPFEYERVDREALHRRGVARVVTDGDSTPAVTLVGVGRPAPGIQVRVLSPRGRALPEGRVGEIELRTPSGMAGYLGQARATRRALRDGGLRTGDLGYLRGEELFWVGRLRERLTVRGRKLDPSDFEAVLLDVAGVRPGCFAAFGIDDPAQGTERVVVAVEARETDARPPREIAEEIRARVVAELGVTVDELLVVPPGTLTKTSSGKRRHRVFKERYLAGRLTAS